MSSISWIFHVLAVRMTTMTNEEICATCACWLRNCNMPIGYCFLHDEPERTEEGDSCDDWENDDDDE